MFGFLRGKRYDEEFWVGLKLTWCLFNITGDTYFGIDLAKQVHCVLVLFIVCSTDATVQDENISDHCSTVKRGEIVLLMELT